MIEIEEIKNAIKSLPEDDYVQFRYWFSERDWKQWDAQIEEDSVSGKLDFLIEEPFEEKRKGKLKEL